MTSRKRMVNDMMGISELEELLHVEKIHAGHFEEWAERATDPMAKVVFRLAADKEKNHIGWVELMIEIAKTRRRSGEVGVSREDLEFWIQDEAGEGGSYENLARRVEEPWIRAALRQMGHDEETNAELLRQVLSASG